MRTMASDRLLLRPWRDEDADFLASNELFEKLVG